MQLSSFVTLTMLALAATQTHAAPCTFAEVQDASTKPELLAASAKCYTLKKNIDTTRTKTDAEDKATCEKNKDCINALSAAVNAMPDCDFNGENMREAYKKDQKIVVDGCQKLGVQVNGAARMTAAAAALAVGAIAVVNA